MTSNLKDHLGRPLVAITGVGHVSCLGLDIDSAWHQAVNGISGIGPIKKFDTEQVAVKIAGEVKNLDFHQFLPSKLIKEIDPFSGYALIAAEQALLQAGLISGSNDLDALQLPLDIDPLRAGVSVGSCMTGVRTLEDNIRRLSAGQRVEARVHPKYMHNMPAGQISIRFNLRGPNWAMSTACATGNHNIGLAARAIQWGEADMMLAGGTDEGVTPFSLAGYHAANALSKRNHEPAQASRPWDRDRDGFVLSEGAGILVLENLEKALNRGAKPLGILAGFGSGADAEHVTKPPKNGHGGSKAQLMALQDAGLRPGDLDYINAHGTSTPLGDYAELQGIAMTFEQDGTARDAVPISSTKSLHGHGLGAAGGIEAGLCLWALKHQIIPATANLHTVDHRCQGFDLVPLESRKAELHYVLSNSYGFGGTTSALIFAAHW